MITALRKKQKIRWGLAKNQAGVIYLEVFYYCTAIISNFCYQHSQIITSSLNKGITF